MKYLFHISVLGALIQQTVSSQGIDIELSRQEKSAM